MKHNEKEVNKQWGYDICKSVCRNSPRNKENVQVNKIRNGRGDIATKTTETQRIFRGYYEQINISKLDNLEEMGKLLETYNLPRVNHKKKIENLMRSIASKKMESII